MMTVRQMQRTWSAEQYRRLFGDLIAYRPEGAVAALDFDGDFALPAAAMAVIRLDELTQSHVPLCGQLVRFLLAAQQPDGGWGDPAISAVCLRALLCGNGQGVAIERGMAYLANLQQADGPWPRIPLRRMPTDATVSALILFEVGDQPAFQSAVRMDDAIAWFERNQASLEAQVRTLWKLAAQRCRGARRREVAMSWS